ncbi:MAG: hypothetical protein LBC61_07835 [Candidatus Peribacteria bacterium]|jgi:hypothetical protein|nr:hypothetical protein [Candidatus Peribacteria bacterium]
MLFDFLKKKKKKEEKIKLTQIAIINLQIPDEQKALYLQALDILDENGVERIYATLINFVEKQEIKELDEIEKNNFAVITGMRKKEAEEKKEEINSFSFLINNI